MTVQQPHRAALPVFAAEAQRYQAISWKRRIWMRYRSHPPAIAATVVLLLLILSAAFADALTPFDAFGQSLSTRLKPPLWASAEGIHLLGTDDFGRDIAARLLYAGRISLGIGFACSTVSAMIGIVLGLIAGYAGGRVDMLIMRASDIQYSFPFLVIAIAVIATFGPGVTVLFILLSIAGWVFYTRITRGQTLQLRNVEYVQAARALGVGGRRIIFRHILPNVMSPNLVTWTFSVGTLILTESSLSFLGLGIQPPMPSWGNMLSDGRAFITSAWWVVVFPGLAITLTILAVNTLGDALRDILDPKL